MNGTNLNQTFTIPPIPTLNFTKNCTLVGQFNKAWLDPESQGPDIAVLVAYFRSALPEPYASNFSRGQVVDWYDTIRSNSTLHPWKEFSYYALAIPQTICRRELCVALSWSGNPDISGVGMLATFFIFLILSSLFIAFGTINQVRNHHNKDLLYPPPEKDAASRPLIERLIRAFTVTLIPFTESASLFSISLSIAATITSTRPFLGLSSNKQEVMLSHLTSQFCFYPVIALLLHAYDVPGGLPRPRLRFFLYVATLVTSVIALNVSGFGSPKAEGEVWEKWCAVNISAQELYPTLVITRIYMAMVFSTIFGSIAHALWPGWKVWSLLERWSLLKRLKKWGPYLAAVGLMIISWFLFGHFYITRQKLLDRSGGSNEENEWGFGQILSLFTWVPILVEFGLAYKNGTQETLQGRVHKPWEVKWPAEETPSTGGQHTYEAVAQSQRVCT